MRGDGIPNAGRRGREENGAPPQTVKNRHRPRNGGTAALFHRTRRRPSPARELVRSPGKCDCRWQPLSYQLPPPRRGGGGERKRAGGSCARRPLHHAWRRSPSPQAGEEPDRERQFHSPRYRSSAKSRQVRLPVATIIVPSFLPRGAGEVASASEPEGGGCRAAPPPPCVAWSPPRKRGGLTANGNSPRLDTGLVRVQASAIVGGNRCRTS